MDLRVGGGIEHLTVLITNICIVEIGDIRSKTESFKGRKGKGGHRSKKLLKSLIENTHLNSVGSQNMDKKQPWNHKCAFLTTQFD